MLTLDADVIVHPRAIEELIFELRLRPDLGAVCATVTNPPLSYDAAGLILLIQQIEWFIQQRIVRQAENFFGAVSCMPGVGASVVQAEKFLSFIFRIFGFFFFSPETTTPLISRGTPGLCTDAVRRFYKDPSMLWPRPFEDWSCDVAVPRHGWRSVHDDLVTRPPLQGWLLWYFNHRDDDADKLVRPR